MTWTPQSTSETAWATPSLAPTAAVLYDAILAYDTDFITYDGGYVLANIDWASSQVATSYAPNAVITSTYTPKATVSTSWD
jgi:hypothetical protein